MKTRKSIRILCAMLSLLLVSQFIVTVLAATSSTWSDGSATYYLETYLFRSDRTRSNGAVSTTTVYHSSVDDTLVNGCFDMYCYENWQGMDYGDIVLTTAAKDGYDNVHTMSDVLMQKTIRIPSTSPTGNYKVLANSICHEINYVVYQDDGWGYTNYMADTVYAPYNVGDFTGYRTA